MHQEFGLFLTDTPSASVPLLHMECGPGGLLFDPMPFAPAKGYPWPLHPQNPGQGPLPLLWRTDQHLALASAGGAWLGAWPASFIGSLPPFCSSPHSCSLLIVPTHLLPFPLLTSNFRFCHQKDVCCSCRLGVLKIFLKEVKLT